MGFLKSIAGGLIGGIGSLIGGNQSKKNAERQAQMNYLAQKEFAQNGIRWRVDDAQKSGIHPLFALGANSSGFTPISGYSGDSGIGDFSATMGQSFDRAMQAKKTPAERAIEELQQQKLFDLEVRQKEANIALTNAEISRVSRQIQQQVPPMPSVSSSSGEIIAGQAQSQPGVVTDIGRVVQFVELPGGKDIYTITPQKDYMDYYSEADIPRYQLYAHVTDSIRNGTMKGPHELPEGYYWYIDRVKGLMYPKKKQRGTISKSFFENGFRGSF